MGDSFGIKRSLDSTTSYDTYVSGTSDYIITKRRVLTSYKKRKYSEFKSGSQMYFSEYIQTSRRWSLWHILMLVVLAWNSLIDALQVLPSTLNVEYKARCKVGCLEKSNWTFDQIREFSSDYTLGGCAYKLYDYSKFCKMTFEEAKDTVAGIEHKVDGKVCEDVVMTHYLFPYTYKHEIKNVCSTKTYALPIVNAVAEIFGLTITLFCGDMYGRKPVIVWCQLTYIVCLLLRTFPLEPFSWYLFTFVAKASMVSSINVSLILFLEVVHFKVRPLGVTLVSAGSIVGYTFKGQFYKFGQSWQLYQELVNCFLLVPLFSHWLLWESPHWLLCTLRWAELEDLLKEINRSQGLNISNEVDNSYTDTRPNPKFIMNSLKKPIFRNRIFCNMFLYSISSFLFCIQINHVIYESKCENMLYLILAITLTSTIIIFPRVMSTFSRPMAMSLMFLVIAIQHTATTIYKLENSWKYYSICLSLLTTEMAMMANELLIIEKFPTKTRATSMGVCKISAVVFVGVISGACEVARLKSNIKNYDDCVYLILALLAACVCLFIRSTNMDMLPNTEIEAIMDL